MFEKLKIANIIIIIFFIKFFGFGNVFSVNAIKNMGT